LFTRLTPRVAPFLLAFLIFAVVSPVSASAASGSYILLTLDNVKGESQAAKAPKGSIDILAFSFGASNSAGGQKGAGGGSGGGKPEVSDFQFTKYQDSASLSLLENLLSGKAIKNGTISFYNGGESQKPYLTIKLEEIFVTSDSYSTSGSERMTESFSLSAKKMTFTYTATGPKGESLPAQTLVYDVSTNKTGQ